MQFQEHDHRLFINIMLNFFTGFNGRKLRRIILSDNAVNNLSVISATEADLIRVALIHAE